MSENTKHLLVTVVVILADVNWSRFDCISSPRVLWSGRKVHTCTRMDTWLN